MSSIAADVLSKIDELQVRYIAALDGKRMNDWLSTFTTDRAGGSGVPLEKGGHRQLRGRALCSSYVVFPL